MFRKRTDSVPISLSDSELYKKAKNRIERVEGQKTLQPFYNPLYSFDTFLLTQKHSGRPGIGQPHRTSSRLVKNSLKKE